MNEPQAPVVASNALLGTTIHGRPEWAIIDDKDQLFHITPSERETMQSLQQSLGGRGAWEFLETNGWHLVRVLPYREVVGVLEIKMPNTSFQGIPNETTKGE